jgi:hypothetical protein
MAIAPPAASDAGAAAACERLSLWDGTAATLRGHADGHGAAMAAEVDGRLVGRVIYTRVYGPRAVLSLDVDEEFMQLGLTELLLAAIGELAAKDGIATFLMRLPAKEIWLLARLRADFGARWRRDGSYVDVELPVPGAAA